MYAYTLCNPTIMFSFFFGQLIWGPSTKFEVNEECTLDFTHLPVIMNSKDKKRLNGLTMAPRGNGF